jgi:hypothetical protein
VLIRGVQTAWNAEPAERADKQWLGVLSALCVLSSLIAGCGGTALFKQYEYEEEMYLSLDGSATLYVNSSIAALNALRGTTFDASSAGRIDRDAVRGYFTTPVTHVVRVSESRRSGRRFVHVRLDVTDVRQLASAAPFSWSRYALDRTSSQFIYRQTVGLPVRNDDHEAGWNGRELTAFRIHVPSKIDYHNTPTHEVGRGNILSWEQPLSDRLKGVPLEMEARMETQSILYRTLWLFGLTAIAVAIVFAAVLWWILRRNRAPAST